MATTIAFGESLHIWSAGRNKRKRTNSRPHKNRSSFNLIALRYRFVACVMLCGRGNETNCTEWEKKKWQNQSTHRIDSTTEMVNANEFLSFTLSQFTSTICTRLFGEEKFFFFVCQWFSWLCDSAACKRIPTYRSSGDSSSLVNGWATATAI